MKEYKGKIRLIVKHYPYKYRDFSHIAAEAAMAAHDQGKFWEMHHLLPKKSPQLDRESLIKYAKEINLDIRAFTESLDKMKHSAIIERDKNLQLIWIYTTRLHFLLTAEGHREQALRIS